MFKKMLLCFLFLSLFLSAQITFADTEVSGIISTDTTWTLAESPYIVTGDINVEEGVKLTIEPSVTIKFDGNYYLRIAGELNAIGTEDGIITFTSSSQASIRWNTIKFCGSSVDAVFDENGFYQSGSIIQYSVIEYAGNSGIFIHGASPFINFCRIRNNNTSNVITAHYNGGGISVVAYDGHDYFASGGSPIIKNCTIINNQNHFCGSAIGTFHSSPIITTNIILENIGDDGSISIGGDSPKIKNNNIVSDNIAIKWLYGYPQITHNTIKGGIYITYTPEDVEKGKINYNNLDKYNSRYAISNRPSNFGAVDIDASNNWWGTTDTFVIDDLIYDYYDDFEEGKVNYIPILNSPDPDAPITLTISAVTGGTTTPSSGSYIYNVGTEVSITAIPDIDYRFSGWTGDVPFGHENDNPLSITIDSDKSITANFIRQYTLITFANIGGTIDPEPGTYTYDENTEVVVEATPESGWRFSGWSGYWAGDPLGEENPVTITMNADKSVTANFIKEYTLTIVAGTGGTTNPTPGTHTYGSGTSVSITANPDNGYEFSGWSGDASGMTNPITITMRSDKSITANFIRHQYTLTIATSTGGTTNPSPGTYTHDSGTQVSIQAVPSSGYEFSGWSGDASGMTNPITITMNSDKSITANFKAISPPEEPQKKDGCFIATAAYGSSLHPHIDVLREFRDEHLMTNKFGRGLVKIYYRYSPPIARLIARNKALKITVHIALLPLVGLSFLTVH